ncbi:MAG: F0F1 ATP synthase subunit delta [Patescibacteria group bacterium]
MKISTDLKNRLRSVIQEEIESDLNRAYVISAHPLTEEEKIQIAKKIESLKDKKVYYEEDPSIIAGFVVKVGSSKYDYSFKSRILDQFQ